MSQWVQGCLSLCQKEACQRCLLSVKLSTDSGLISFFWLCSWFFFLPFYIDYFMEDFWVWIWGIQFVSHTPKYQLQIIIHKWCEYCDRESKSKRELFFFFFLDTARNIYWEVWFSEFVFWWGIIALTETCSSLTITLGIRGYWRQSCQTKGSQELPGLDMPNRVE